MKTNDEYKEELSESGAGTGIEADDPEGSDEESILEPFDPDTISIEQKVVPMDSLLRRLKQRSIRLSPNFQRNEVWNLTRRSRLIESILLRIPLPMFYVAASEEGEWEVVDGLQRLSTIRNYLLGDADGKQLKLTNLEFLGGKLDGKTFKDLEVDQAQQRLVNTIMETEMRFTVINPGTPEAVKRNIFKRINTGGMPLTSQEIRHALYQGQASSLLESLVSSPEFKKAIGGKVNDTRMAARELILRFISFLIFSRKSYRGSMDSWLSNTMRVVNAMPELEDRKMKKIYKGQRPPTAKFNNVDDIQKFFTIAMHRAHSLFGEHAFRKSLPGSDRKTPINKALFETWSNALCKLDSQSFDVLMSNREELLGEYSDLLNSDGFISAISKNSSQNKEIYERYRGVRNLISNVVRGGQE